MNESKAKSVTYVWSETIRGGRLLLRAGQRRGASVTCSHLVLLYFIYFITARTRTNVYLFTSQLAVAQALDGDEGMSQRMPFSTLCQR
jgi:hypothetical protein